MVGRRYVERTRALDLKARASARWARRGAVLPARMRGAGFALVAVGVLACPAGVYAQAPVPCTSIGGGKVTCSFYVAGDGHTAGARVQAPDGVIVGYLPQGVNWVTCQRPGQRVVSGPYFNRHWAHTVAENGRAGWVNAVWATGGDNDGPFANVPDCGAKHEQPPGAARSGGPVAPPPPPRAVATPGRPRFEAPWPCGQVREYYHHRREVPGALDFNIPGARDRGTPVLASAAGIVTAARYSRTYGNMVDIAHGGGWTSRVAHLDQRGVSKGDAVAQGFQIGKVGTTGRSDGPHLHYEQLRNNRAQPIVLGGQALRYSTKPASIRSRPCR